MIPHLTLAFALLLPSSTASIEALSDEAELLEELLQRRDDADPALLEELAELKSAAAAAGLVEVYDSMASLFMRLETLKALRKLDGAAEAEQVALRRSWMLRPARLSGSCVTARSTPSGGAPTKAAPSFG